MFLNAFEASKLKLKVKITKGKKKSPKCTFKFEVTDGDAIADQKGKVSGEFATCEVKLPECKEKTLDDKSIQEFYTVAYKVIDEDDGNKEYPGPDTYKVWPRNVKVTLLKDNKGTEEAFPGVEFKITQVGAKDVKGVMPKKPPYDAKRESPGAVKVVPDLNYKVKTWKKGQEDAGREREGVLDLSFEAAFLDPQSGTKIEQFVNHESAPNKWGTDGKGSEVKITVGAKGDAGVTDPALRTAIPGADVFIKVTFTRSTDRTKPEPALKQADSLHPLFDLKKSKDLKVWTGRVVIGAEKLAYFKVDLGIGGGEECKVEIGVEKDKPLDTLEFQNWRKLEYECWMPANSGAEQATDYTKFKPDGSAGLAPATTDYFKKILDQVFVKFTPVADGFLDKADLPAAGAHNIVDGGYVDKTAGDKVLVLELDTQAMGTLNAKGAYKTDPRVVSMIWCDLICDAKDWNETFQVETDNQEFPTGTLRVFKNAVVASPGGVAHGAFSIAELHWCVSHYKDGAAWKAVSDPADPGYAHRNWTKFASQAEVEDHIEFVAYNKVKFKLPTTAGYPGGEVTMAGGKPTDGGKDLIISFAVVGGAATEMGFNGAALKGDIWMSTYAGDVDPVGMGAVVLHELGHNMGMAYGKKSDLPTFGQPSNKQIPGIPYPAPVTKGDVYEGKDHTGPHCAAGLAKATKAAATYQVKAAYDEHTCLMFGAASMKWTTEFDFCDQCKKILLGRDLSDIRKYWGS